MRKKSTEIQLISLFSGAGGLDLGFERQGFKIIIAYDREKSAIETYNFNRDKNIATEADLSVYSGQDIINDLTKMKYRVRPQGVIGGPPCQYFSNGNKSPREDNDPRRKLPVIYAKNLKILNAIYNLDFFLFENVRGLVGPAHSDDLNRLLELFEEAGFHVYIHVLDAYNFGVAQTRNRVFIIGWNKEFYTKGTFKFPQGNQGTLTVEDAIGGLPEPKFFTRNLNQENFREHPNHWTMKPRSPKFTNPPPPDLKRATRSFRRLSWREPSYTVAYGHNEIHVHPNGSRRLSIYEAMLLQGFPNGRNGYRLCGNLSEQVTLASNAAPPPLAEALAISVKQYISQQ